MCTICVIAQHLLRLIFHYVFFFFFFFPERYTTANAESDYDRESERESEEGEDEVSCETVRTVRRDSLDLVNEDETPLILDSLLEEGLGQLLQQADRLHNGHEQEKREGFQLLLNNKLAVKVAFLYLPAVICVFS